MARVLREPRLSQAAQGGPRTAKTEGFPPAAPDAVTRAPVGQLGHHDDGLKPALRADEAAQSLAAFGAEARWSRHAGAGGDEDETLTVKAINGG